MARGLVLTAERAEPGGLGATLRIRVTDDDKTEAFASWLRDQGIELTASERSLIAGFVALAGRRPVGPDDIAQGVELARGAAISEDARLERLGAQLLAFEATNAAAAAERSNSSAASAAVSTAAEPATAVQLGTAAAPARVVAAVGAGVAADDAAPTSAVPAAVATEVLAATIAGHIEAELEPASPLKILIRTTAQVPVARPAAVDQVSAPRPVGAAPRWPRTRTRKLASVGAALAAAAAAGAFYLGRAAPAPPAAPATHAPAVVVPGQRLRRIALGVRLPDGWREASDAELGEVAAQRDATVVFRGTTPADPEHGVFVAAAAAQDGDLIATARTAERGVIGQLGIAASAYQPAGCALVELAGGKAARCRGIAEPAAGRVAVEIYVRTVGARTIVALSLAKPSQATAAADAAAIVASFTP
jgi:hypothetical protein